MLAGRMLFIAAFGALVSHTQAQAQDASDQAEPMKVEVTGSRINRVNGETALPVQIIKRDEIERANWTTAAEIMAHVSANFNGFNDQMSVGDGTEPGAAYANLRGVGSQSTLVLLNGRRLANYAFFGQSVDLNSIPAAALERVEILKDGASSIYGTDAIAGVVNFITRKDYTGLEVTLNGQGTQQGGAGQKEVTVTGGYGNLATDRFNGFLTFDWQKTAGLAMSDRSFSSTAYRPDAGIDNLSSATFPANIYAPGGNVLSPALATGCSPPVSVPHTLPNGSTACGYDYAVAADDVPPTQRVNVIGRATVQLTPRQQLFAEYVYTWNDLLQRIAASPSSRVAAADGNPILYPADGPYYPTTLADANGLSGDLQVAFRTVALGPRTSDVRTTSQRATMGTQGTLGSWDYDAAYTYSENVAKQSFVSGYVSSSELASAMYTGTINPFGPSTPAGEALLASTQVGGQVRKAKGWTNAIDARVSNEFMALPGGPAAVAFGVEGRTEDLNDDPGDLLQSGDVLGGGSQIAPQQVSRNVAAAYVELNLPLTRQFEAQLSARYDHYSDVGGTTNPKVGVRWQPASTLVFRASWGTGFRAPSLPELHTPRTADYVTDGSPDPIRCPGTGTDSDCFLEYQLLSGGNPALQPETSAQWSTGIIWEPAAGTSVALDYWSIRKTNAINTVPTGVALSNIDVYGSTNVIRGPVDPAHPSLPGPIIAMVAYPQNVGDVDTAGIDIDVVARANIKSLGLFTFRLNGTYVTLWQQTLNGLPQQSFVGGYGIEGPIPRWRHYAALNWNLGYWSATLGQSFQGGYTDLYPDLDGNSRDVGAYSIWDLQGSYSGFKNLRLTAGVHNLFNRDPPFTNQNNSFQVGYDPAYADPRGASYYMRVTYAFK